MTAIITHALRPPAACIGHWYEGVLYLAPVFVVVAACKLLSWRDQQTERTHGPAASRVPAER